MYDELSGGEAQRVAMAARLILSPQVLLLDEPTASVDAESARLIRRAALNACRQWNTTIVVASHDREWLHGACDELYEIYRGKPFRAGLKSIIPGPFVFKKRWGAFCRPSATGQSFIVPYPPQGRHNAAAVLDTGHVTLTRVVDADKCHVNGQKPDLTSDERPVLERSHALEGTLQRLMHAQKQNQIIAGVRVNDLDFNIPLSPEMVITHGFVPGARIMLTYIPNTIQWF